MTKNPMGDFSLHQALNHLLDQPHLADPLVMAQLKLHWPLWTAGTPAAQATPAWFHHGTLGLRLEHSALRHELLYQRTALRTVLNTHLGREYIHEIRLQ